MVSNFSEQSSPMIPGVALQSTSSCKPDIISIQMVMMITVIEVCFLWGIWVMGFARIAMDS